MRRLALAGGWTAAVLSLGCSPAPPPDPPASQWRPPPSKNLIVAAPTETPSNLEPGFPGCYEPRLHPKRMSLSDGLLLDIDRDGRRDLVAIGVSGGPDYEESLFVLSGGAGGEFALRSREKVPAGWMGVVVGDFNGDGKPDLAADDYERGTVDVRLGAEGGGYGSARVHPIGAKAGPLSVADLDGDGRLDLAVPMVNEVKILKGTGTGSFIGHQTLRTGKYPARPALVDLDRNGKLDLVVASNDSHRLHVFMHDDGRLRARGDYACGKGGGPIAVGDFDGDGIDDIAMGNLNSHTTCVFSGKGDGRLRLDEEISDGGWAAGAADLDRDGRPELMVSSAQRRSKTRLGPWGALSVYRHEEGRMVLRARLDLPAPADRFWVHDMDGDEHRDVVTIGQKGLMVLLSRPCPR
ncbi:MAG TPA: VCBS repeat-containing protein [Polyangiaceae bacterium]|nr:VCBS repeat-containing protein [Polyangiaceae bacterium]